MGSWPQVSVDRHYTLNASDFVSPYRFFQASPTPGLVTLEVNMSELDSPLGCNTFTLYKCDRRQIFYFAIVKWKWWLRVLSHLCKTTFSVKESSIDFLVFWETPIVTTATTTRKLVPLMICTWSTSETRKEFCADLHSLYPNAKCGVAASGAKHEEDCVTWILLVGSSCLFPIRHVCV